MANKSNLAMVDVGPPNKRRRTHHSHRSPRTQQQTIVPSTEILPSSLNNSRQKKIPGSSRKREPEKREEVKPALGQTDQRIDYLTTDKDNWKPDFRSTFPLAKALERRRVLVDYIFLMKRLSVRKDNIDAPSKRLSIIQPQTIEELEKEIAKCHQELDTLAKKRDENADLKKNLMARYKALYKEEDEERKKLQLQEEQQKAAELSKSSEVEKLLSLIGSGMITPEMFQQYMTSTQLASTNTSAPANTIFQSIQQNLLNSSTASSSTSNIPTLDLTQYINNVSQYAKLTAAASAHQQQQASLNASKPSTNVNQPGHGTIQKTNTVSNTTMAQTRTPSSSVVTQASLLNPSSNSSAASLNFYHSLSATQNPFVLTNQQSAGLLTQQAQGGLISPQTPPQTSNRDPVVTAQQTQQQFLHGTTAQQQSQNRASPNLQTAASLLQAQTNPFMTASNPMVASVQQQQAVRSQDIQQMVNQLSTAQGIQNLVSLFPGGLSNPQAIAMIANLQQQQQQLATQQLHQSILTRAQVAQAAQAAQAQKQSYLSTGLLNAANSCQSPLTTASFSSSNQPSQSQQPQSHLTRKTGAINTLTSQQQQAQLQNRLQLSGGHHSIAATNLAGRSATPQFAVPNLAVSAQSKIPPRAQSTRPPINFGSAQSVITSTIGQTPTIALTPQQQSIQNMFQASLDTNVPSSSSAMVSQQIPQELLIAKLTLAGFDQNQLAQMLLLSQQGQLP